MKRTIKQSKPTDLITMRRIPLIGESVLIVHTLLGEGKPEKRNSNTTYYYLNPVSINTKNPHNNSLPTSKTLISVTIAAAGYGSSSGSSG